MARSRYTYGQLGTPEGEPHSYLLSPLESPITLLQSFLVAFGERRWCVSRPEVLQGLRALRRLELRDAEPPEDVEPTLFVLDLL